MRRNSKKIGDGKAIDSQAGMETPARVTEKKREHPVETQPSWA